MTAVEDELDFSSYLVDIDDDDGGLDSATNTTNAAFASSSYITAASLLSSSGPGSTAFSASSSTSTSSGRPFQPLQTSQAAKNWPAGIIQQHQPIGSISPSPTESTSDSSYKASSYSAAGTAPSSIASSSYPDSGTSWGTQKTFVNPKKSHASTPSSSLSSSVNASLNRTSALSSSRKSSTTSTPTDNTPPASSSTTNTNTATQIPALNLSFNYDFAHNPALGSTALSPASGSVQSPQPATSSSYNDSFDPAQYSASLPSSNSRSNGFSSRHGSSDRLSMMDNQHGVLGKPISPSSGPQHVSKGHRNRQSSASNSMSTSLGSGGPSPHWLSMTPATPSIAVPQFASTPYSRPVLASNDSNSQLGTSLQGTTSGSSMNRRPSKRKNTTSTSSASASIHQMQTDAQYLQQQQAQSAYQQAQQHQQYALSTTSNLQNSNAPGMQQFGFPLPGPAYRDPASSITSPISPNLESMPSFANFVAQNASIVTSPSQQYPGTISATASKSNSNASTPNDAILSAITAPSPFDPRNFGSLSFDPLSDDFNSQLANLGAQSASQSPASAAASQTAIEMNKAAALAGIGGKWMNWSNSQGATQESDATLISNVLANAADASTVPIASGSGTSSADATIIASAAANKEPAPFDPFPARMRESSVIPSGFGDIDGESPEDLAAADPLATHLWRLYAKAKAGLPNGARMENITWRMMGLKLNKQKADAAAAGFATPLAPQSEPTPANKKVLPEEPEERGRRGRNTAANSASPGESGDFAEMDWRQQSRSRSRVPQAIAGGMDWRDQSRSRSRAPAMRLSMPSGPQGFHLPTYADIVETMASVSRAPQDVSTAISTHAVQHTESSGHASGYHSRQASSNVDLQSFERTLRQYIAESETSSQDAQTLSKNQNLADSAHPSSLAQSHVQTSALPYSYVPPAPLAVAPTEWLNSVSTEQNYASLPSSMPGSSQVTLQQQTQARPIPNMAQSVGVDASGSGSDESSLLQSQKSISASVEAYLSSLEHATSIIDLPPHRHVGSIPGLFNEQELKANQHADYGFLPKLVRKTSFDASYPAQLAHEHQKQSQKKRGPHNPQGIQLPGSALPSAPVPLHQQDQQLSQSWADPNNLFLMDNINSFLRGAAQSVPSTPSAATANMAFNLFANAQPNGQMAPFASYMTGSPDSSQQAHINAQLAQAQAQTAAVEAFRRLQTAQALQAAAQQQQQQQQTYAPYSLDSAYSPGSLPTDFLAALSPGQYANINMHVNPSQTQHSQYPSNVFPNYGDPNNSAWPASPQSSQTSPAGHYTSPEDYAAAAEDERLRSTATSRSSSLTNIPSLLSHSFTSIDHSADVNAQAAEAKKSHSRQQSTVGNANASGNGDSNATPTVCINCKTTNTPLWRRDENGQPLCNACQLFRKLHGSDRPVSLHNSVVKKRNRTRNKEAPKKSTSRSQRRNSTTMPAKTPEDTTPEDT